MWGQRSDQGQFLVTCRPLGEKGSSFLAEVWALFEQSVCRLLILWMLSVSLSRASISVSWKQLGSAPSSSTAHSSSSADVASDNELCVNYVKLGISCQLPIKNACKSLSFWCWPKVSPVLCQLGSHSTVCSWSEVAFKLVAVGQWGFWSLIDILVYGFIPCHECREGADVFISFPGLSWMGNMALAFLESSLL